MGAGIDETCEIKEWLFDGARLEIDHLFDHALTGSFGALHH